MSTKKVGVTDNCHCLLFEWTGLAGFEPTHDGVKVRCLTAWL